VSIEFSRFQLGASAPTQPPSATKGSLRRIARCLPAAGRVAEVSPRGRGIGERQRRHPCAANPRGSGDGRGGGDQEAEVARPGATGPREKDTKYVPRGIPHRGSRQGSVIYLCGTVYSITNVHYTCTEFIRTLGPDWSKAGLKNGREPYGTAVRLRMETSSIHTEPDGNTPAAVLR
jgi:hypothetical protein